MSKERFMAIFNRERLPLALGALLLMSASAVWADDAWRQESASSIPAAGGLRGYGGVSVENMAFGSASGRSAWVSVFKCQDAGKAEALVGKFLADLGISPGVEDIRIKDAPAKRTASGAVFVVSRHGADARIVSAPSQAAMTAFLEQRQDFAKGAASSATYPAYLDRFDRYGWGCYGMGGFNNFHEWMGKDGAKKDPTEDMDFMIKNKFRVEPWLDPAELDNSDGIVKNNECEWITKLLSEAKIAYSFRVYGAAGGANWVARRFPEYLEQPASWMMCGWLRPWLDAKSSPHLTWFDRDIQRYMAVKTMDLMKPYADDPMNMSWMHPAGELEHQPWYDRHDDYSPRAAKNWRGYLRQHGFTLEQVSRMYGKDKQPFGAWEQIPIPEFATFAGLGGLVEPLEGTWFYRQGRRSNDRKDSNFPGLAEAWYKQPIEAGKWRMIDDVPGNDHMYEAIDTKNVGTYGTTWFRRSFGFSDKQLAQRPIYFYWFPMSSGGVHSGEGALFHQVFVNGEKAGDIGSWGALDVSKLLRPGENEIALQLLGPVWQGRAFLSTEQPSVYPYLGKERNRLFLLWQDWHVDAKYDAWTDILDGMRQVDPNRPIKYMAPIMFRADRWLRLAHDWGGFGHFTGEGQWFFPWYKRYGFLYDVPGSSELAGPADTIEQMFDGFRRVFLAGLNAHEPVFLAQSYTRPPEMRRWWETHNPVLKRLGKYDIDGPQVLLYRSTHGTDRLFAPRPYPVLGEATRPINNAWDWDLGRGSLQTLGHSYLYLDDQGLADGKMNKFPLMVDCGNETIPDSSLDALDAWVKAGGVYVALPFSGRNSELEPDAWKISTLTGCEVGKLRPVGQGEVSVKKDQSVFKTLAGKIFPDAGKSIDCNGNNLNLYSVELKPGKDCEVLATYENGQPAIVRRKLGEGSVIALGSAFWRDCADRHGIWWPGQGETDFLADLLAGLGFPQPACSTDDRLVWAQPYRSNNGLDAVTCLVSWHDDKAAEVAVTLRLPHEPAAIFSHGVDGDKKLPFTWKDGVATVKVDMPPKEVKVLDAVEYGPDDAVAHWWAYQRKMWRQLKEPTIDFTPYRQGKWADPTLDLRQGGAEFTMTNPDSGKAEWKACPISILNFWGAEPKRPVWLRKKFVVPQEWRDEGGKIFLISGAWSGGQYEGSARLSLNGEPLHDFSSPGYRQKEFDVTRLLNDGGNELSLEFKGDSQYQGVKGQLYLYHWTPPARRIDLGGEWIGEDSAGKPLDVKFPGQAKAWSPMRTFRVPEEWKGKYQVRLHLDGEPRSTTGAYVNGRLARRHHHVFETVGDLDITRFLRFGEDNRVELVYPDGERDPNRPPNWDLRKVELHLREVAE